MAQSHDTGHDHVLDHKHGTMDITVQEQTFAGFVRFVTWTVVLIVVFLVLLAMFNG